ncbi:flagellar hook-length control protein FliK, partial [Vibrio parahaemolyticus]
MMISSSLPSSNAASSSEGRITQAKDVQGFSQRSASGQTPLNQSAALSEQAVPSFRLAAQTFSSEERKEATTATTEENAAVDTTGMNVLLSATTPTETPDLAAQAQTLTQGMLNMAEKSVASFNKVNPLEVKGEAKTTSPAQANALLNT